MTHGKPVDLLLVHPPLPRAYDPSSARLPEVSCPPLGLLSLAAAAEVAGYSCALLDMAATGGGATEVISLAEDTSPSAIGLSATTPTWNWCRGVAAELRAALPDVLIVIGGPHVTGSRTSPGNTCSAHVLVAGEGESAITDIMCRREEYLRQGSRGPIMLDVGAPPIEALPAPARGLVPLDSYVQAGAVVTSRGCNGKCIFCAGACTGPTRCRQPEDVAAELHELAARFGVRHVYFHDPALTGSRGHAQRICDAIHDVIHEYELVWWAQARIEDCSPEILAQMADAGCRGLAFGIEAYSEEVRTAAGKTFSNEQVKETLSAAYRLGIRHITCSFIIGLPGDHPASVRESIAFARRLRRIGATSTPFAPLIPYPGTAIGDEPQAYGVTIHSRDWDQYVPRFPLVSTATLSRDDIRELCYEAWSSLMSDQVGS